MPLTKEQTIKKVHCSSETYGLVSGKTMNQSKPGQFFFLISQSKPGQLSQLSNCKRTIMVSFGHKKVKSETIPVMHKSGLGPRREVVTQWRGQPEAHDSSQI